MSQAQQTLEQLLAGPGELGFVDHLPEATASRLAEAAQQKVASESAALEADIRERLPGLPGWLRGIATSILS